MVTHVGEVVGDQHRLARILKPLFDLVEPENAVHLGHVEVSVPHGNPVRHEQVLVEGMEFVGFAVPVIVAKRVDATGCLAGANENRPVLPASQRACAGNPAPDRDLETGGE